jgi:hypothetical protein
MSITTVADSLKLLGTADWNLVRERMSYKFPAGHVRIVDDFLLKEFGERNIDETKTLGTILLAVQNFVSASRNLDYQPEPEPGFPEAQELLPRGIH